MKSSDTIQAGMILGCGAVATVAGAALLAVREPGGGPSLEGVLGVVLSGIGLAVVGVWVLLFLVAVLAELLQRRGPSAAAALASRCAPTVMRRLAAALLGVNLLAAPAMAEASTARPECMPGHGSTVSAVDGPSLTTPGNTSGGAGGQGQRQGQRQGPMGPSSPAVPDAADAASPPVPPSVPPPVPPPVSPAWEPVPLPVDGGPLVRGQTRSTVDAAEVVVAPGDSLWSITGDHLGPLATAADIAEAWPAWYDTNRAVIGIDPSLLLPGMVLRAPTG